MGTPLPHPYFPHSFEHSRHRKEDVVHRGRDHTRGKQSRVREGGEVVIEESKLSNAIHRSDVEVVSLLMDQPQQSYPDL